MRRRATLKRSQRRPTAAATASALALAGCSFGPIHGYTIDEGTEFTSTDLEIIRRELGSLPETPPEDPTNVYADDRDAAVLGQQFFFERRYSANGEVSCATCHDPAAGFQDRRANTSEGLSFTGRHAPSLYNAGFGTGRAGATVWQFWDGRKDSLWSQALGPPESGVEMGGTRARVALLIYDKYRASYTSIFGQMPELRDARGEPLVPSTALPLMPDATPNADTEAWDALPDELKDGITRVYVNFGKAIAAYERLLVSRDARFDAFYAEIAAGAKRSKLLDAEEALGLKVFIGEGKCVSCHIGPNFSDWKFHNIGVDQEGDNVPPEDDGRAAGLVKVTMDPFNCASDYSDRPNKEGCAVSSLELDDKTTEKAEGAFKTPSLRGVSETGPYFHTGEEATLEDVVEHYDKGGDRDGHFAGKIDPNVGRLDLGEDAKAALVSFLKTLDGAPLPQSLLVAPPLPK